MILFFDTETTGLPDKYKSSDHPSQPSICQIAMRIDDENGRLISEFNFLVAPQGWAIPPEATKIHGISTAMADAYGLKELAAITLFQRLVSMCSILVGHNIQFDQKMLEIVASRYGQPIKYPEKTYCTMQAAKNIVKCPPSPKMVAKGMTEYKVPNLTETYLHFFGKTFEGAHDAMNDVRACREIYYEIEKGKHNG